MYITISAQKTGGGYSQSSSDIFNYLEKENEGVPFEDRETFFNQYEDKISRFKAINDIDTNTAKLKKKEPKFYSITLNPNKRELKHITGNPQALRDYTRNVMKAYATSFNREINGRPVNVNDIVYYAKLEKTRSFKYYDKQVLENRPFLAKLAKLKRELVVAKLENKKGNTYKIQRNIDRLKQAIPNRQNGEIIKEGMKKDGLQAHIHIIVSRKDRTNAYSLSPGSKYKSSQVEFNGKQVSRGFNRDAFFEKSEKTFDKQFNYQRSYISSYKGYKDSLYNPKQFFLKIAGLPANEKVMAFQLLKQRKIPMLSKIPTNKAELIKKAIDKLIEGGKKVIRSSEIGI